MTYHGTLRTYAPQNDIVVIALVFLTSLLLILLLGHQRRYIANLFGQIFMPTNRKEEFAQKSAGEQSLPFFSALILSCSYGLLNFTFLNMVSDFDHSPLPTSLILAGCISAFGLYLLLRYWFYRFVNWVFFSPQQQMLWANVFSLQTVLESAIFYLIMCIGLFNHIKPEEMIIMVAICYLLVRFAFIPCTKRIFFPSFYGYLHLIAYLCALEIVPLLILWHLSSLKTFI